MAGLGVEELEWGLVVGRSEEPLLMTWDGCRGGGLEPGMWDAWLRSDDSRRREVRAVLESAAMSMAVLAGSEVGYRCGDAWYWVFPLGAVEGTASARWVLVRWAGPDPDVGE